ncbi:MAG TPA: TauD/TfdA family dioxygenase [Rugosimonospora sp.]|nr:TauD/TfdA family dioxygenase [Rugosimonospora sp.]
MTITGAAPIAAELRLTLDSGEHARLRSLAGQLADTPPALVDDDKWVAAAMALSAHVPARVRDIVRDFKSDPGRAGTLLLHNLPVGENLPPTPVVHESVERRATVAAATQMLLALQLGEVIAYREEKHGALVQNVVPVPGHERRQSNAGSVPLELHVENAFHPHRPDYVALLCLRPDPTGSARLIASCVRQATALLPVPVLRVLGQSRFTTQAPPSFVHGGAGAPHPVLAGAPEDPDVVVDFHATTGLDSLASEALAQLRWALTEVAQAIAPQRGDLVVLDNRLTIHGRTGFDPRYDGTDRWLHRTFVHLDHRRSRASRPGNGRVLV